MRNGIGEYLECLQGEMDRRFLNRIATSDLYHEMAVFLRLRLDGAFYDKILDEMPGAIQVDYDRGDIDITIDGIMIADWIKMHWSEQSLYLSSDNSEWHFMAPFFSVDVGVSYGGEDVEIECGPPLCADPGRPEWIGVYDDGTGKGVQVTWRGPRIGYSRKWIHEDRKEESVDWSGPPKEWKWIEPAVQFREHKHEKAKGPSVGWDPFGEG